MKWTIEAIGKGSGMDREEFLTALWTLAGILCLLVCYLAMGSMALVFAGLSLLAFAVLQRLH